jgi:Zn-dependent peptidase ImmA (M78 family)/transcriptional regulator with XRE-family HTH domain
VSRATYVPVNPAVLSWALEQSGMTVDELAYKLHVDVQLVEAWRRGLSSPTKGQFTDLIHALRRPSSLFFRSSPPEDGSPKIDFRAPTGGTARAATPSERLAVRASARLQGLASWIAGEQRIPDPSIPTLPLGGDPAEAAAALRRVLGPDVRTQIGWTSPSAAFGAWRAILENAGAITQMFELGRTGVRGFSISGPRVPLIAVNTAYGPNARTFTLFHEVGHLVTRTSSACLGFSDPGTDAKAIEPWCEEFSAAFLLPADALRAFIEASPVDGGDPVDQVQTVSRAFKVSARAVAIRLIRLELAERSLYRQVEARFAQMDFPSAGGGQGQDTAHRRLSRMGRRSTEFVLGGVQARLITKRDALRYLNVNTGQMSEISELLIGQDAGTGLDR